MEGDVVFRRDTKLNLLEAVSGTEWMYRRGALERGKQVSMMLLCLCVCMVWPEIWQIAENMSFGGIYFGG